MGDRGYPAATMAETSLRGNTIPTSGDLPAVGSDAPDFTLVQQDLSEANLASFAGKKILNIFPSIDTPVCATSVRTFNEKAGSMDGVTVINVSADLPFALKRFCGAEGLEGVTSGSTFRGSFLEDYGMKMAGGPLAGLAARSIVVIGDDNKVLHAEVVPDIGQEPDYDKALAALG